MRPFYPREIEVLRDIYDQVREWVRPVFTHIENDHAQMVDISAKTEVPRRRLRAQDLFEMRRSGLSGGTVKATLATARVAATRGEGYAPHHPYVPSHTAGGHHY